MAKPLPRELWINIIQSIDSVAQIGECRLVCKGLNAICEPIMLSKEIVIKSEVAAVKLYDYLYNNPFNSNRIKHLKFDYEIESMTVIRELLRVAFTPTLESLAGVIEQDEFYLCLNKIATESPVPFTKLKRVPRPTVSTERYVETLFTFRHSLEEIEVYVDEETTSEVFTAPRSLPEFHCLTSIIFDGIFYHAIKDVEDFLIQYPQLQQLALNGDYFNEDHDPIVMEQWRTQHVVKSNALKRLTIHHCCAIETLEYLLFKFTNVEVITLDLNIPSDNILHDNDIERAMNALKQSSLKQIHLKLALQGKEFKDVLRYLVNNRVSYAITEINDTSAHISINHF